MSTINVNNILPESGDTVDVNALSIRKENNSSIGLGDSNTLSSLTSGDGNIGLGVNAVKSVTAGFSNIGIGTDTLESCVNGNQNIAIGSGALSFGLVSANANTAIGNGAGQLVSTGNNIVIGWITEATTPTTDNSITLGNSYHNVLRCAVTSITSLSDARDKDNVKESPYGLDFVNLLKPVTFDWNTRDGSKVGVKDLGFIAQDLKEVDDEYLGLVYSENPEKLEASYGRLIPVLVKAIQELSEEVKQLKNK